MTDPTPYCIHRCGRPATTEHPIARLDSTLITDLGVTTDDTLELVELVCGQCE